MGTMKTETKGKQTPHIVILVQERATVEVPEDMIIEILSRLPARSVCRLRCVSKSWLSISTTLSFVRSHAQRSPRRLLVMEWYYRSTWTGTGFFFASADSNARSGIAISNPTTKQRLPVSIIKASWGGILCLWNTITHRHSLFNPLTCNSINLPNSTCQSTIFLCLYLHRSTSKYRLIRLSANNPCKSEVLVVGESSWRRIPGHLTAFHHHPHPVEFNDRLHWLACTQGNAFRLRFRDYKVHPDTIMTFDTETEKYNRLPLPPMRKNRILGGNLVDFNGELGLWNIDRNFLDLWIMESSKWVKRYSVDFLLSAPGVHRRLQVPIPRYHYYPWLLGVAVSVGDEELLIDLGATIRETGLLKVNLKHGECRGLCWHNCRKQDTSFPYVESLTHFNCNSSSLRLNWVFAILSTILFSSFLYYMLSTLLNKSL